MAVESKASVKSRFETNDTPTQTDFGNLIDSYQDVFDVLQAIGTAAQGGKFGVIEIKASAEVTALPVNDVGRAVLAASSDSTDAGIQVVQSTSQASARQAIGITGSGAVIDAGDLKPFLRPSTDILWLPARSWIGDPNSSPTSVTKRWANVSSVNPDVPPMTFWTFDGSTQPRLYFDIIHPNSMPDGSNPWKFEINWWTTSNSSLASTWLLAVADGVAINGKSTALSFNEVTAFSEVTSNQGRDRMVVPITVSASSNADHLVHFRLSRSSSGSTDETVTFVGTRLIIPASAHNED